MTPALNAKSYYLPGHHEPQDAPSQARIDRALERLKSSIEGPIGITEIVGFGTLAVPALRSLLFEHERSGLYEARCRAINALAALEAFDVLADFLRAERPLNDAVERLGEDVVVSAAARSLAVLREAWVYDLLRSLAARKTLNGVLAGLGTFMRTDSIPILVDALAEDEVRFTAMAALRRFGEAGRQALLTAATDSAPHSAIDNESRLRKRRSALSLLVDIGVPSQMYPAIRPLTNDRDPEIARLARIACTTRPGRGLPSNS